MLPPPPKSTRSPLGAPIVVPTSRTFFPARTPSYAISRSSSPFLSFVSQHKIISSPSYKDEHRPISFRRSRFPSLEPECTPPTCDVIRLDPQSVTPHHGPPRVSPSSRCFNHILPVESKFPRSTAPSPPLPRKLPVFCHQTSSIQLPHPSFRDSHTFPPFPCTCNNHYSFRFLFDWLRCQA